MNTANKLTILRLFLVIPFIVLMSTITYLVKDGNNSLDYNSLDTSTILFIISGIIFAFAMFTDFLDGYIARKTNTVTTFGKLFDPLADKFMTTSALIFLAVLNIVPVWVVVIFILRDILVDGSRNIAAKNNLDVAANIWGKLKTLFQSFGIILLFVLWPVCIECHDINSYKYYLLNTITFVALGFSVASGIIYFGQIKHVIKLK
ncbi:CDP-diacylglycerol--glycerol-3-phosphate 3-phosphatidyltransferase [Mycoplasma marinum]|uniref:CDP-diacylglycerol--glycerol-3-phosphate 3-phosphatidyltransferase n=1 Tax=Mycoplasma marinum TaxID=1937190 RepID=A0A4R0XY60_9MOLU|nr:CDP-diacylglycerol--glycerol-3-phosphate 3-phosphatidyltransferase [Mycoplasma marinum]TCG11999.1 CDP-diacylglycerol--glycerol-3-phosphate 3-phosphatidyltransferase [Mycoplasma marinum]